MLDHDSKYEYEVAFSFLHKDEGIVFEINDLFCDRYKTFIYSNRQKELVGTDGEKTFNEVFSEKARIVVILYREEWGKTSWTRIEETAIRNRAHSEGYDFTTFIQLDSNPQMPKWLPKSRIYYDYARWGVKGFVPIIEARIQEAGGSTKPFSLEEQTANLKRKLLLQAEKKKYLDSKGVFEAAHKKFDEFCDLIKTRVISLEDKEMNLTFHIDHRSYNIIRIYSDGITLIAYWKTTYSDSLQDSEFLIELISINHNDRKRTAFYSNRAYNDDTILKKGSYNFDFNPHSSEIGWSSITKENDFFSNEILIDRWLQEFIKEVSKIKIDKQAKR